MAYDNMTLGQRLKRRLSEKDMKQKQLATILKVPESTTSAYFRDINQPDIVMIEKLADVLDTTVEYLITGKRPASTPLIGEYAARLEEPAIRAVYEKLLLLTSDNLELASEQIDAILKRQQKNH